VDIDKKENKKSTRDLASGRPCWPWKEWKFWSLEPFHQRDSLCLLEISFGSVLLCLLLLHCVWSTI